MIVMLMLLFPSTSAGLLFTPLLGEGAGTPAATAVAIKARRRQRRCRIAAHLCVLLLKLCSAPNVVLLRKHIMQR
jgi:hypothetical protein